jgi:hypothetical protein
VVKRLMVLAFTPTAGDEMLVHGEKSLGVRRMEAVTSTFTKWTRVSLFVGIFLTAYAYGLDGTSTWSRPGGSGPRPYVFDSTLHVPGLKLAGYAMQHAFTLR